MDVYNIKSLFKKHLMGNKLCSPNTKKSMKLKKDYSKASRAPASGESGANFD